MWSTSWLFLLETAAIVAGNTITIVIFTRTPRLRRRKHVLIVSLAVADLFVGLISVPMYVYCIEGSCLPLVFIKAYKTQDPLFGLASLFGLAALAIERAYATFFPFKHRTLSKFRYAAGIAVVWACALSYSVIVNHLRGNFQRETLLLVILVTSMSIPLIIMMTSYALIWIKMTCMRGIGNHGVNHVNKKLTVTLVIVTIVSLITWMPFQVISLCRVSCLSWVILQRVVPATKFLHYGNSCVNIIIYAMRMPEFKNEVLRRLRRNPPAVCPRTRMDIHIHVIESHENIINDDRPVEMSAQTNNVIENHENIKNDDRPVEMSAQTTH